MGCGLVQDDLNLELLINESKNYMIGSTVTKSQDKIYYADLLVLLRMKNKTVK